MSVVFKVQWSSDVLPDSVVFADPTNTYGVRRADNQQVLVNANTPLDNNGGGLFTYNLPGEIPKYEIWIRFTRNGQVVRQHQFLTNTKYQTDASDETIDAAWVVANLLFQKGWASDIQDYDPNDK